MHSTSSARACDARHETTTMSHGTCRCLMGGLDDGTPLSLQLTVSVKRECTRRSAFTRSFY
eukprot:scaffold8327_cov58-Phaeocystis_antarctica.AAC.2